MPCQWRVNGVQMPCQEVSPVKFRPANVCATAFLPSELPEADGPAAAQMHVLTATATVRAQTSQPATPTTQPLKPTSPYRRDQLW